MAPTGPIETWSREEQEAFLLRCTDRETREFVIAWLRMTERKRASLRPHLPALVGPNPMLARLLHVQPASDPDLDDEEDEDDDDETLEALEEWRDREEDTEPPDDEEDDDQAQRREAAGHAARDGYVREMVATYKKAHGGTAPSPGELHIIRQAAAKSVGGSLREFLGQGRAVVDTTAGYADVKPPRTAPEVIRLPKRTAPRVRRTPLLDVRRERLDEHAERVLAVVRTRPGLGVRAIMTQAGMAYGPTTRALVALEKAGQIRTVEGGLRRARHYPA